MTVTLACKFCSHPFEHEQRHAHGRRPEYCSGGCRRDRENELKARAQRERYNALKAAGCDWRICKDASRIKRRFEAAMAEAKRGDAHVAAE